MLNLSKEQTNAKEPIYRGALYAHDHNQIEIRKHLSSKRREELLTRYYQPHWQQLKAQAAGAILIDLHTYPPEPWKIERHAHSPRPEIDIGFTEGLALSYRVSALFQHFRKQSYEVQHNTPYEGVIDAGAKAAVMIEIQRDVVGQPSGTDPKWNRLVSALRGMPLGV